MRGPEANARRSRRLRSPLLIALLLTTAARVDAQQDAGSTPGPTAWWIAAGGVLLGGALLLDESLRTAAIDDGGLAWDDLADRLNPLGNPRYLAPALVTGWAAGRLAGASELSEASAHVLAVLIASGVANGTLKAGVGRERPAGGDPLAFRPFSLENRWQSFPSGHAVVAFSVASALSGEADRPWVTAVSYGTASLVGWSRVYEDEHWASDVVGGALVGIGASRLALQAIHRHRPHGGRSEAPLLIFGPTSVGVQLRIP